MIILKGLGGQLLLGGLGQAAAPTVSAIAEAPVFVPYRGFRIAPLVYRDLFNAFIERWRFIAPENVPVKEAMAASWSAVLTTTDKARTVEHAIYAFALGATALENCRIMETCGALGGFRSSALESMRLHLLALEGVFGIGGSFIPDKLFFGQSRRKMIAQADRKLGI